MSEELEIVRNSSATAAHCQQSKREGFGREHYAALEFFHIVLFSSPSATPSFAYDITRS
jgi:hypothetical protein